MLSQIDAFFVAYQERSGILMQLGAEIELKGTITPDLLETMLKLLTAQWPQLGRTVRRRVFGLARHGDVKVKEMLHTSTDPGAVAEWRNRPIDPFTEPSFQLLWVPGPHNHILAFRAHHAVTDGQAFFNVCTRALHLLAGLHAGEAFAPPGEITPAVLSDIINPRELFRQGKLKSMWRYVRWLARESKAGRSARIAKERCEPGPIATCERTLGKGQIEAIRKSAAGFYISPLWLCAAAWMRAINKWNVEREGTRNTLISLELPVSLRGKEGMDSSIGNFISPLVLFGDAGRSVGELGVELKQQFFKGVRDRSHLGVPFFTGVGKYLPWWIFRRTAVGTTASGFATSHITWLEQKQSLASEVFKLSGGTLELLDQHIFVAVCLHMGAALFVLVMPESMKLVITHRLNALPESAANRLADLLIEELF